MIAETVACVPEPQREAVEQLLVPPAKQVDPLALRRLGQHAVYTVNPDAADAAALARYERRGLSIAETFGGMVALQGVLDPIGGATVLTALEALAGPARRAQGPSRTAAQYGPTRSRRCARPSWTAAVSPLRELTVMTGQERVPAALGEAVGRGCRCR